ncbi:DUF423 domain-containing protein [Rhodohalobacter sp.]|uniref:DUF423 domain-containing protein n=1 Tax=Rhodohalobacter sp. TaxID=1974210 RepID=UPI003565682A
MKPKSLLIIGSIFMAFAVAFGAFGAHIVQDMLTPERFEVYKTGVEYHFYHAIGLLLIGVASFHLEKSAWLIWSSRLIIIGILIFSGSLYILTLTNTGWLGAITPLGGVAFILGWSFFAVSASKESKNQN